MHKRWLAIVALLAAVLIPTNAAGADAQSVSISIVRVVLNTGEGSVVAAPAYSSSCQEQVCTFKVPANAEVVLRAAPAVRSELTGWKLGPCHLVNENVCTFTAPAPGNTVVTRPVFSPVLVRVFVLPGVDVSVKPRGESCGDLCWRYAYNSTKVTVTVTGDAAAKIKDWGSACEGNDPSCTVSTTRNLAVTPRFGGPVWSGHVFTLKLKVRGVGKVLGPDVECPPDCERSVRWLRSLSFKAKPKDRFVKWKGACRMTSSTCAFSYAGRDLTAIFEQG